MSGVFAITFGRGSARSFLARNMAEGDHHLGWRPLVWTRDIERAELFSSFKKAATFGLDNLTHPQFGVTAVPPRKPVPPSTGGSPILMAVAA